MKPLGKISTQWSPTLAYALGLIVTDGCLYNDGRHFSLTSNDRDQLQNFMRCLGVQVMIGQKVSGFTGRMGLHAQFGDVLFCRFLLSIGLMSNKTKVMGALDIPDMYFFDFLRGHHDGDGSFYAYWDPRWKSSYMFYLSFISASKKHVDWLQDRISYLLGIKGHINKARTIYQLKYAKKESLQILQKMYYSKHVICLRRKREKIEKLLKVQEFSL